MMERLTKNKDFRFEQLGDLSTEQLIYQKLQKLENLEEQIGCPLEVRCQLYNGRCVYGEYDKERILGIWVNGIITMRLVDKKRTMHKFSNYKKTWWLKADRSE